MKKTFSAVLLSLFAFTACDDTTAADLLTQELGVVVNSQDRSLTIFQVDDPTIRTTVGVGPDGSPVTLAVRGEIAVVPLGTVPAAAIVNVKTAQLVRTVALPAGSGATGVAFVSDSIALVANPNLQTVTPINVNAATRGADIPVGLFPQAMVSTGDTVYVLNAQIGSNFQPTGPGTVSVIAGSPLHVVRTITLRGTNPGNAAVAPNGRIYVVNSGRFGVPEGSVSILDRATLTESGHVTGFRSFPAGITVDGANRVYVAGFDIGLLVWDAQTQQFVRGASNDAVAPGGTASTSGVGVDSQGRVYALQPTCNAPSVAYRLAADFSVQTEIPVGTCPLAIAFTKVAP